jgi:polysaccharide biosynthesis protein PslH
MKILFLTPQIPYPPRQGAALRNWGLIAGLARRHEVSILSFASATKTDPADEGARKKNDAILRQTCQVETAPLPIRSLSARLHAMLFTRQPDMALRLASEAYALRLAAWLARESFDVVQIGGIEMSPYLGVLEAAHPRPLIVFDNLNCEYLLQKRAFLTDLRAPRRWIGAAYSFVQWRRLRRYEAQVCRRADRVVAVSAQDAAMLEDLVPGLAPTVVPNGVNSAAYPVATDPVEPFTLVFTGAMDFRPNVDAVLWFTRHVLPLIQAVAPETHLLVVGQRPHRRLDPLRANSAVTLTGWVAETQPYIARAAVYVAPLRIGGGTRLKLLEAMAMGKALVSTRLGAEGYPVEDGRELVLADSPEAFAAAVIELLHDPERRAALGRSARAFVEAQYDWRHIVPRLEAVYTS